MALVIPPEGEVRLPVSYGLIGIAPADGEAALVWFENIPVTVPVVPNGLAAAPIVPMDDGVADGPWADAADWVIEEEGVPIGACPGPLGQVLDPPSDDTPIGPPAGP